MLISNLSQNFLDIHIRDQNIERVNKFNYFGTIRNENNEDIEIRNRKSRIHENEASVLWQRFQV